MADPRVLVMMATYNGGNLLTGQIDSILAQEDVDVTLLISDDGSTDGTAELCETYARRYENIIFRRNRKNLGATWNFMGMVYDNSLPNFDYYAFSDQDDYWLSRKLSRAIQVLKTAKPGALYYSNITNVGVGTEDVVPPFVPYFANSADKLGTLLVLNWAFGCTMVFDQVLLERIRYYIPSDIPRYHDTWIHLIALSTLSTAPDFATSLIRHQYTGENLTGRFDYNRLSLQRIQQLIRNAVGKKERHASRSARELLKGYRELIHPEMLPIVETAATFDHSLPARLRAMTSGDFDLPMSKENAFLKIRFLFNYL